jgi:methylthioribose-1-phosphate isomerase
MTSEAVCPAVLSDRFNTLYYDSAGDEVVLLDRRVYPFERRYRRYATADEVAVAIETMVVQGGPPLAYAAGLALAQAARKTSAAADWQGELRRAAQRLLLTRPTADDLHHLIPASLELGLAAGRDGSHQAILEYVNAEIRRGNEVARACGWHAASLLADGDRVLTHCFAGAALCWMLWHARLAGKRVHLVASETRPYFQGARLTAQSCVEMDTPCAVITDGMSAHLMSQGRLDKFICAADRITLDGHITNKVGTLMHAIAAAHCGVPFYVLGYDGPDPNSPGAADIVIEERRPDEVLHAAGREGTVRTAVEGVSAYYPAFDITPPTLITAIATDRGIYQPGGIRDYFQAKADC